MFLIYSINLDTFEIKILDKAASMDTALNMLKDIVIGFIKKEQGENNLDSIFKDSISDDKITNDGYFIRNNKKTNVLDVYKRITHIKHGSIWGYNVTSEIKKMFKFGITELAITAPKSNPVQIPVCHKIKSSPVSDEKIDTANSVTSFRDKLMEELLQKVSARNTDC